MAKEIESFLDYALNVRANELIVTEGLSPAVRFLGKVRNVPNAPIVEVGSLRQFLGSMSAESGELIGGPWCSSRWRVRYSRTAIGNAAVFRPLLDECPDFFALKAPQQLMPLLNLHSGLVVFAGPACCGKTTSASAYVSALCKNQILRVSLLDSLPEYEINTGDSLVLKDSCGNVYQKITQALRSGIDLIWLGDLKGLSLVPILRAAESGALVVLNVTAGDTVGALDALLASESVENRDKARNMLAFTLKSVVVQKLVPTSSGAISAWEILYATQNVAMRIRSGEHYSLPSIMSAGASESMLLMDDCIQEFVRNGTISKEIGARYLNKVLG